MDDLVFHGFGIRAVGRVFVRNVGILVVGLRGVQLDNIGNVDRTEDQEYRKKEK